MDFYMLVKTLHIVSGTIVFGTGIGIANFMFFGHRSGWMQERAFAARMTVTADFLFTLPSVIIQPVSGAWLVCHGGFLWGDYWLVLTYGLLSAGRSLLGAGGHNPDADESNAGGSAARRGIQRGNL